jgi:hypothetical protein
MMALYKWKASLERERKEKDKFFVTDWQSPIPLEERAKFKGLAYYLPDPNYRFELELNEHKNKKILQIQDTNGNVRNFIKWGEFRFGLSGKEYILERRNFLCPSRTPPMIRKHTEQDGISTSIMKGIAQQMESGFLTLIKHIIHGVHIV